MNDWMIFQAGLLGAAALSAVIGILILRLNPEKTAAAEAVARWRLAGSILGLIALIWCVPHARPICFGWMLDYLYPAAVAGAVLGYYFLDYHFSRAMGGIMILSSYFFVHGAFDWHTPGLPVVSVNRTGMEGDMQFWGGSFITNAFGALKYQAPHLEEALHIEELDLAENDSYRRHWPYFRDRRIDSYQPILKRFCDNDDE